MTTSRPLRVFLCHSSADKPAVRELYQKLRAEPWIEPWLDEEELYPGQDWNMEIEKAIKETDAIIVCLSKSSVTKEGYVQKEIRIALDYADYKPERALFIIPIRLEECDPPLRLNKWQYEDYFDGKQHRTHQRLLSILLKHAVSLGIIPQELADENIFSGEWQSVNKLVLPNGMEFMYVPMGTYLRSSQVHSSTTNKQYDYWLARYPVTNLNYLEYIQDNHLNDKYLVVREGEANHPAVYVTLLEAKNYSKWLNNKYKSSLPSGFILRLPYEAEWEKAACGYDGREYPWGNEFDKYNCNTSEGREIGTTPVTVYSPKADSPYGCADMSGNVWEWTSSVKPSINDDVKKILGLKSSNLDWHIVCGGSWRDNKFSARLTRHSYNFFQADEALDNLGFRICLAPPLPE